MRGLATVTMLGVLSLAAVAPAGAQQPNPCAAKNPAARTVQNPCAVKNQNAKNPCATVKARFIEPDAPAAVRGPSSGDLLFGAGPTLRPLQAR
jgi:hypothetical protein